MAEGDSGTSGHFESFRLLDILWGSRPTPPLGRNSALIMRAVVGGLAENQAEQPDDAHHARLIGELDNGSGQSRLGPVRRPWPRSGPHKAWDHVRARRSWGGSTQRNPANRATSLDHPSAGQGRQIPCPNRLGRLEPSFRFRAICASRGQEPSPCPGALPHRNNRRGPL